MSAVDLIKAEHANPSLRHVAGSLTKGAQEGHEFYGNQHTGGSGDSSSDAGLSSENANNASDHARMTNSEEDYHNASDAHVAAAEAHTKAARDPKIHPDLQAVHSTSAREHQTKAYTAKHEEIKAQMRSLSTRLDASVAAQAKDPKNWGHLGDLNHISSSLKDI